MDAPQEGFDQRRFSALWPRRPGLDYQSGFHCRQPGRPGTDRHGGLGRQVRYHDRAFLLGRVSARVDRFDMKQPLLFYYSANTPPEFVEAVKDGILYWNIVFGKEVVKAMKAPDGVDRKSVV